MTVTGQAEVQPGRHDPGATLAARRHRLPGFDTEVGPLGHLPAERARLAAIYDGLPDDLRQQVDPLVAVHDFVRAFGHDLDADARAEMRRQYPPVRHPVIRTHPETGRRLVYVNRFFVDHIQGLDPAESLALVDQLCALADQPEYQCRFHWDDDAVAFWDNRAVQHYACSDYWPDVRIMERASIIGDATR